VFQFSKTNQVLSPLGGGGGCESQEETISVLKPYVAGKKSSKGE
jgi:hypothetical protein